MNNNNIIPSSNTISNDMHINNINQSNDVPISSNTLIYNITNNNTMQQFEQLTKQTTKSQSKLQNQINQFNQIRLSPQNMVNSISGKLEVQHNNEIQRKELSQIIKFNHFAMSNKLFNNSNSNINPSTIKNNDDHVQINEFEKTYNRNKLFETLTEKLSTKIDSTNIILHKDPNNFFEFIKPADIITTENNKCNNTPLTIYYTDLFEYPFSIKTPSYLIINLHSICSCYTRLITDNTLTVNTRIKIFNDILKHYNQDLIDSNCHLKHHILQYYSLLTCNSTQI